MGIGRPTADIGPIDLGCQGEMILMPGGGGDEGNVSDDR
jgi:hypothetical protein